MHRSSVSKPIKITWAQAFRDIVVEALRRGQIVALGIAIFLIIYVARLPSNQLYQVWDDFRRIEEREWTVNLILNVALALLWFVHARRMRQGYEKELARVAEERNRLQEKLGIKVKTSK
jgi:hypothetical protein